MVNIESCVSVNEGPEIRCAVRRQTTVFGICRFMLVIQQPGLLVTGFAGCLHETRLLETVPLGCGYISRAPRHHLYVAG